MAPSFDPDKAGEAADKIITGNTGSDPGGGDPDLTPDDIDVAALTNDGAGEDDDPAAGVTSKEGDFEHKYNVLQGKYNAEIGRLQDALSTALLEKERMASRPETDPVRAMVDQRAADIEADITALQDEYPNLFRGLDALLTKKLTESLQPVRAEVANVAAVSAKTERERYLDALDTALAGWRDINVMADFKAWLELPDRYTGAPKKALLGQAYNSFNVESTKAFFEDFAREKGIELKPGATTATTAKPGQTAPKRGGSFDIAPTTTGAPLNQQNQQGPVSRADIEQFYKDRAMGRFAGTEEDAVKYEAKIMKAVQDGKVR